MLRLSPMQLRFLRSLALMLLVNGVWAYLWGDAIFVKGYGLKDMAFYAYTLLFLTFSLWSWASLRSAMGALQSKRPAQEKNSTAPSSEQVPEVKNNPIFVTHKQE